MKASSFVSYVLKYFLFFRLEGNSETNACNSLLIKITCELCHHVPEDRCVFGDLDDLPTEKQVSGHPENW